MPFWNAIFAFLEGSVKLFILHPLVRQNSTLGNHRSLVPGYEGAASLSKPIIDVKYPGKV